MKATPISARVDDSLSTSQTTIRGSKPKPTRQHWAVSKSLAVVVSVLALGTQVQASTTVSGIIDAETWTTNGSPYMVVGDILVSQLDIQPGVEVRFQGGYEFQVAGVLTAQGTPGSLIWFHPADGKAWKGIFFNESVAGSMVTYCRIEGSTNSGLRILNSLPIISNCVIANNSSPNGGGLSCSGSLTTLTVSGCILTNNTATTGWGGGAFFSGAGSLQDCLLSMNYAGQFGGGVGVENSGQSRLINCIIATNSAGSGGGGVVVGDYASADMLNCTILGNNSGIAFGWTGAVHLTNSIMFFNGPLFSSVNPLPAYSATIAYSDVQGGVQPGIGNISANPVLNPTTYMLLTGSPCIDAGSPDPAFNDTCFPPSRGTATNDMGAYGGPGACGWVTVSGNAPTIVKQPASQAGCLYQTVTFSVGASGAEPLAYQWFFQNAPIAGQTNAQLTLTNVSAINVGAYYVTLTNHFGGTNSDLAQLVVYDPCIELHMYAGLTISGEQGSKYVLSYSTDLGNTNGWVSLATNTMGSSSWFYLDMDSPFSPYRFYKANRVP